MKRIEKLAWELYCEETAGSMDIRDFWNELSPVVKRIYLDKAEALAPKSSNNNFHIVIGSNPGVILDVIVAVWDKVQKDFSVERVYVDGSKQDIFELLNTRALGRIDAEICKII